MSDLLSTPDLSLFAQLLRLRLTIPLRYRRLPLDRLLASLDSPQDSAPIPHLFQRIQSCESWIDRIPGIPRSCLFRSLARFALLRHYGQNVTFLMGLPAASPSLPGHAWIGVNQCPVEAATNPYLVTFRYPPA